MGVGASQKAHMNHARHLNIVAVASLTLHQALGTNTLHRGAYALVLVVCKKFSASH
jgi:hypothetical protein